MSFVLQPNSHYKKWYIIQNKQNILLTFTLLLCLSGNLHILVCMPNYKNFARDRHVTKIPEIRDTFYAA